MVFEFRAHRPSAYSRFAILLMVLVAINLFVVSIFFPELKSITTTADKSIILMVPWLTLLFLPSVIFGILIYRSFVKTFHFTIEENSFTIQSVKKNKDLVLKKEFEWKDLKSVRIIDFEDNHYCNLEFSEKKNNLVIHRETGDFENFYSALEGFLKLRNAD